MLLPQGFLVPKREFEALQRQVVELQKQVAELIAAQKTQPEPRKYVRRDHG